LGSYSAFDIGGHIRTSILKVTVCRIVGNSCNSDAKIWRYMLPESSFDFNMRMRGFGGLEDACWTLVPKVAGSNPAEAVGRAKKILSTPSS
jgi:hypothetical protein